MKVAKVAAADNGDGLAAFDPESWLKVCAPMRARLARETSLYLSNLAPRSRQENTDRHENAFPWRFFRARDS